VIVAFRTSISRAVLVYSPPLKLGFQKLSVFELRILELTLALGLQVPFMGVRIEQILDGVIEVMVAWHW
jgi:hypothetical protein